MNFYFEAANVLDRIDNKRGSIKGILGSLPEKDRRRTSALVIETLKYKAILTELINSAQLLQQERQKISSFNLALLLVHDLLFSKGIQAGDGPIKQAVLRHKTRLHGELQKLKIRRGVKNNAELAQNGDPRALLIPRYVRVNTLRWTVEEALRHYHAKGYNEGPDPCQSTTALMRDEHIPELLRFHPLAQFNDDDCLSSGQIILQDKASCFPAKVLAPPAEDGVHVIDATAAPGNKTSHLSAIMKGKGKIFAFERDRHRYSTLRSMLEKAHCTNVEAMNSDFLLAIPSDPKFKNVTHILLDPSCSGSGIVNRLDYLMDLENDNEEGQDERLQKLAVFQLSMIKHAMKFSSVAKIVYSTCSVHAAENEDVVDQALCSDEAKAGNFELAPREIVLPGWNRRGMQDHLSHGDAGALIRCLPGDDRTNGFFVSCFVRNGEQTALQVPDTTPTSTKRSIEGVEESVPVGSRNKKKRRKR